MTAMSKSASSALRFSKMHGAGNDFVVLDLRDGTPAPTPALAAQLANRHTGVGCDQILTIEPPREAGSVAAYRIWNSDGSQSEQCGNGARCIAAWLVRDGAAEGSTFNIDSPLTTHAIVRIGVGRVHARILLRRSSGARPNGGALWEPKQGPGPRGPVWRDVTPR